MEKEYYVSAHFKWDASVIAASEEEARNIAKVQFIQEFGATLPDIDIVLVEEQ